MRTKINIHNDSIQIVDQVVDFNRCGVYLIKGKNGSGKSSLIREIVFRCKNIEFESENTNLFFSKRRNLVFSYIEQNPQADFTTVRDYIIKHDGEGNSELLIKYFRLDYLSMNERVSNLSGGEIARLNIISQLKYETPYIFLDEPSNNLDDESTFLLMELIKKLAVDHSIIIATHDPRMQFDGATIYEIENNRVLSCNSLERGDHNKESITLRKNTYLKTLFHLMKEKLCILTSLTIILAICLLAWFNYSAVQNYFNFDRLPPTQDMILCYEVDDAFADLNRVYTDGSNLEIDETKYSKLITYDDLHSICDNPDVKNVIIADERYLNEIYERRINNRLKKELTVLSIPYDLFDDYSDILEVGVDVRALDLGTYPKDNKNEICLSIGLIEKFYPDVSIDKPIGEFVSIDSVQYKIVGITHEDYCLLSYDERNLPHGFVSSKNENYSVIIKDNIDFFISEEAMYTNVPSCIVVNTTSNKEKKVLDELITEYPANNYYSFVFASEFAKHNNAYYSKLLILINLALSLTITVLMLLLLRRMSRAYKAYLHNIDVYYLKEGKTKRLLFVGIISVTFFLFLILAIIMMIGLPQQTFYVVVKLLFIPLVVFILLFLLYEKIEK